MLAAILALCDGIVECSRDSALWSTEGKALAERDVTQQLSLLYMLAALRGKSTTAGLGSLQ